MAISPQTNKEALSALEDALGVNGQNQAPAAAPLPGETGRPGAGGPDLFGAEPQPSVRRPANDDRAAIGAIIQTLQRRPPRTPYLIAAAMSVLWVIGAAAFGYAFRSRIMALGLEPDTGVAFLVAAAAAVLVPIAVFFTLAHTIRRSQELRLVAQTMAEVAMRLAEPETAARESIVNVGQAIRREVTAMGDGVERALARAAELEALVHNEVSALERAYNDNEVRIRDLLGELSSQRESLVGQAEQVRNAITGVHLGLQQDINAVGDLISERVAEVAQRVTRSLTEKGENITLALGHAGDSMIEALTERSSALLDRLERTNEHATTAISSATEKLSDSLTVRTDQIQEEYSGLAANLQQLMSARLDQVAKGFAQQAATIIETMAGRSQQMTELLAQTGGRVSGDIAARVDEVNRALHTTGDSLLLDLNMRGNDVIARMEQTGARAADTIVARSNAIADTFQSQAEALTASLERNGAMVGEMLATRLRAFDETFARSGAEFGGMLDKHLHAFDDTFAHNGTELSEKIARESTTLGNLIVRHVTEFDHTVKTYGNELIERLAQRTQEVSDSMRSYVDGFDSRVSARTEEISGALDQRLTQFEQLMGSKVSDLARTLGDGSQEMLTSLDRRIGEVGDTIDRRGDDVVGRIAAKAAELDATIGARADAVAGTLDSRIGKFEELLVGRAEAVAAQLEDRTQSAADALNARAEELSRTIAGHTAQAEQSLGALTVSTADAIRASAGEAERSLGALSASTAAAIRAGAGDAEQSLTAVSDKVRGTLRQSADDVEQRLIGVSQQVAESFTGKANEITEAVTRQTGEMTTLLSDRSGGVLASIVERGRQFSDALTRATAEAVESIERKGLAFTQTMMNNSEDIARLINSAGEAATGTVNRTLNDLQNVATVAIEQSKRAAAQSVSDMLETHNMLRSDSTALYERLREANILLQEVLSGAHANMATLENTMMLRVSDFVGAMKEVTEGTQNASTQVQTTIDMFRDNTSRLVKDLGALTTQFEQHGRELNAAIELLDRSNMRTEDAVNERRVTLDSLISTLDLRTEDLDQRLRRFSGLLDESLESAAARAREIARVVSESSVESAHVIADQFDRMRAAAENEREQTVEAMRAVYEQATGESDTLLRQAADRFAEIMGSVKSMAAEMQSELDQTREELRRGILELPQETAESAMQMRRVLVDQIEALAELNRIVARHGRSIEQGESSTRRAPREETQAPAATRPERQAPRSTPSSFAPPPRSRAETSAIQANKGWLTELLNRASREEAESNLEPAPRPAVSPPPIRSDERTPRHTIESLDSLSVDIARMIDHDAAADLWDRYKRGERNVFTRRLYTLQGQKAFDEIRAKYRGDREFKQTVDRYIAEFERLLDDVSRDDRGQIVARTYLTSETGKVYTMLAHAAGRFEQG
jgi:hypothetical protein